MSKNRGQQNKNKVSSKREENFFIQTNIDDLLNATKMEETNIASVNAEIKVDNTQNDEKIEIDTNKTIENPLINDKTEDKIIEEPILITDNSTKDETMTEQAFVSESETKNKAITDQNEQPKEGLIENLTLEIENEEKNIDKTLKKELEEEDIQENEKIEKEFKTELKPPQALDEQEISEKKKLDEAEQSVSKHNTKKRRNLNVIFFIVNILVVVGILVYQLLKEDIGNIGDIGSLDVGSLFVCILLFGIVILFDTTAIGYLLKQSTGKWSFGFAYKVAEIGRYYDCVTPMATGGQPFQISYLKSRGMPVHTSLSIPLAKYEFQQMSWVVLSFICLLISFTNKAYGTFVGVTSILGFCLSSVMLFVTVFLSVCKSLGRKIVVKVLRLLYKMKLIKNYDRTYEKITKYISDFQDVMKQYAKSPKDFIVMFILCVGKYIINYSIPFFIVKLFSPTIPGSDYITLFVMSLLVDLASSFFPLPGGTGMNEISFTAAFSAVIANSAIKDNILVWVLLVWRFFSYYVYLIQGMCILSYDMAYGNRKYKWQVKRDTLVEESTIFKQNQIDKFRAERSRRRRKKMK